MPSNEANKNDSPQNWFDKAKALALYLPHLLGKEIWRTDKVDDKSLRGSGFALLRILTITVEGILRNRVPSQAGALSYYTLIAIAPTLAIGIMVAGFVFQGDDAEDKIVDGLTQLIYYIAPPAEQATGAEMGSFFDDLDARHPLISSEQSTAEEKPDLDEVSTEEAKANVDPKIQEGLQGMVRGLVKAARSGTLGAFGSLMLIWISVQLLSTIEKTFNQIWGVKQARNLMQRLVFYWTLISLGALLGFTSLSIGIYGQIGFDCKRLATSSGNALGGCGDATGQHVVTVVEGACGHHHLRTFHGVADRHRLADAAAGSRDHSHFACEYSLCVDLHVASGAGS